jgi:hypothetical protein
MFGSSASEANGSGGSVKGMMISFGMVRAIL